MCLSLISINELEFSSTKVSLPKLNSAGSFRTRPVEPPGVSVKVDLRTARRMQQIVLWLRLDRIKTGVDEPGIAAGKGPPYHCNC